MDAGRIRLLFFALGAFSLISTMDRVRGMIGGGREKNTTIADMQRHADDPDIVRVLFIGNSYTFQHGVPDLLQEHRPAPVEGRKQRYETAMIAEGGAKLISYVDRADVVAALNSVMWDYVVLQGQSTMAFHSGDRQRFEEAVRWFGNAARGSGARLVLFETWPRRPGDAFYASTANRDFTPPRDLADMTQRIAGVNEKAALSVGAMRAPVGRCWLSALEKDTAAPLYADDGSHASKDGAQLAAQVIHRTLARQVDPCAD